MNVERRLVVLLVAAVAAAAWTNAFAKGKKEKEARRYFVVRVLGTDRETRFEVIGDVSYREKLKEAEEGFRDAALDWKKARREAKKNKEEFREKPPCRPQFKKMKSFKDQKDADEYAAKIQELWDKKMAKRHGKKGEKDDDLLDDDKGEKDKKKGKKDKDDGDDDDKKKDKKQKKD